MEFCRHVAHWTAAQWSRVIWSDESAFQRLRRDLRHVWRCAGSEVVEDCVSQSKKFSGGPGIMVWGAAGGPLHTKMLVLCPSGSFRSPNYIKILKEKLIPTLRLRTTVGRTALFMHDGARCHTSRATTAFLHSANLKVLPGWPPNSPDLNPIEGWWGQIKYSLQGEQFSSQNDVWEHVLAAWNALDSAQLVKLATTMPARIQACLKARGGHFRV